MIPSDVTSRMQAAADTVLRPVAPTQEISDKLSDLKAGQRVMAEIQALLPNGTYRAMINQRNITLALPFSAKSGDSLELLVTQSQGRTALAVIAHQEGKSDTQTTANASASATLSRTGQLISNLLGGNKEASGDSKALALNNGQPILNAPMLKGADILPMLRQAISQSGMFYESHQAQWLAGKLPVSSLLEEPQGKLSASNLLLQEGGKANSAGTAGQTASALVDSGREGAQAAQSRSNVILVQESAPSRINPDASRNQAASSAQPSFQTQSAGQIVAPQAQGIVQQQLSALAVQNFVWQGQIWPDQDLHWEIEDQTDRHPEEGEALVEKWQTGVRLNLPVLGGIDARIRLQGDQITLTINADNATTVELMRTESEMFRRQLSEAGLMLATIGIALDTSAFSERGI